MATAVAARRARWQQRYAAPLSMAIPVTIFSVAALALPLATARALELSAQQLGGWLLALYGIPAVLSVALTRHYRQPLLVAWHTQVVVFLAALAGQVGYAEMLGALVVSGALVLLLGAAGLTGRLATLIPA